MRAALAWCSAAATAAAVPAPAEGAETSPSPRKVREARYVMHEYAECVVRVHGEKAEEAILSNATNADIQKKYRRLIDGECLGNVRAGAQMSFGGDLFRYALADALVNAQFADGGPADFSDRPPLSHADTPELADQLMQALPDEDRKKLQPGYDAAKAVNWVSKFGECVVRRAPEQSRQWLRTKPSTEAETAAIGQLRSAFGLCLEDGQLTFNRTVLRGTVALNYFRLAKSAPMSAAGKAN